MILVSENNRLKLVLTWAIIFYHSPEVEVFRSTAGVGSPEDPTTRDYERSEARAPKATSWIAEKLTSQLTLGCVIQRFGDI